MGMGVIDVFPRLGTTTGVFPMIVESCSRWGKALVVLVDVNGVGQEDSDPRKSFTVFEMEPVVALPFPLWVLQSHARLSCQTDSGGVATTARYMTPLALGKIFANRLRLGWAAALALAAFLGWKAVARSAGQEFADPRYEPFYCTHLKTLKEFYRKAERVCRGLQTSGKISSETRKVYA